ncbi:hypothetical protein [Pseudoalteromonas phenolica]|uniref:hypothetical protein n=1 Tax=Pseudoalteromonas phenolica TaxID=161398 RepID=UPI00148745AB|nr:hypothetical protein [Pseudoalteromonas phenolica]
MQFKLNKKVMKKLDMSELMSVQGGQSHSLHTTQIPTVFCNGNSPVKTIPSTEDVIK